MFTSTCIIILCNYSIRKIARTFEGANQQNIDEYGYGFKHKAKEGMGKDALLEGTLDTGGSGRACRGQQTDALQMGENREMGGTEDLRQPDTGGATSTGR